MTIATFDHSSDTPFRTYRRSADCAVRRLPRPVAPRGDGHGADHGADHGRDAGTPNYVVRRLVAIGVVAALLAASGVAASALLAGLGGDPAVAAETPSGSESSPVSHVARSGETLWSIADAYRGDVGQARYVDALVRLNGGAAIEVGQAVVLP